MEFNVFWGFALGLAALGVLGAWFYWCGRADKARQLRAYARRTLLYAGVGFVVGVAFLTSDLGNASPEGRSAMIALTICSFLLVYSATSAMVAADDQSTVLVNLTGRPLLLSDPALAPFYTLPAPQDAPAVELPPILPRTYYVVSSELGHLGARAGRTDLLTVDSSTADDGDGHGPVRVGRLLRAVPSDQAGDGART